MANTIDELARQVIAGKYGNGATRKSKLGAQYDAVQDRVNQILSGGKSASSTASKTTATVKAATPSYETKEPKYSLSSQVTQDQTNENNQLKNKPVDTSLKYDTTIADKLNELMNRKDFSYDFNADPLYQQYKDQYTQQGNLAMRDTMGQAAALSGGYGNTYATTAGSQAFQGYLSQLNNVIPDLYNAAYNQYKDEGTQMESNIGLLQQQDQLEHGKYADSMNDYMNFLNYYEAKYQNDRNFDYSKFQDEWNQWNANRSYGYTKDEAAKADKLNQDEFDLKKKLS